MSVDLLDLQCLEQVHLKTSKPVKPPLVFLYLINYVSQETKANAGVNVVNY